VTYDLTNVSNLSNPTLIVSDPGRLTPPWCSCSFHVRYSLPLSAPAGTVQVPVSALEGAGVYGIGIQTGVDAFNNPLRSDFAFTRVAPSISSRPPAPLFSSNGSAPSHVIDIPNGGSFQVSWDATNVPGANGAILEASAAGPTTRGNYNTFNNPNGSVRDQNGLDGGSLYYAPLAGVKGSTSVSGSTLGLIPTLNSVLRVIATHNGTPVGEAGEVSFVSMDGVAAADGGFVNNGYAINDQGNDAFLTSGQNTATGDVLSSVETFDQKTNRVTSTVTSSTNKSIFFTPAWGTFAGDIGLFGAFDLASGTSSYNLLNPVATGTIGTPWTSPDPNLLEAAQNDGGDTTAFLAGTPGPGGSYHVFSSNLTANTSGPEYDISAPISSFAYGFYNWIAENPGTNTAVVAGADLFGNCTAPVIDTINLTNGQQVSSTGLGAGYAEGLAVDPSTNRAFVLSSCDNGIETYDLASHTGTLTTTGGFLNLYAAVDQQRKELLVTQLEGDDASYNNNALSNVLVLNEDGTPVKTIERFNFFNGFLPFESNSLQINSGLHQGYIWGYLTQQLEPFTY
jgi:hypothetical protein